MLIVLHLSLMTLASLCLFAGVGTAMFGRRKKNWLAIHKRLNLTGVIVAIAGGGLAVTGIVASEGDHFARFHHWIGIAAILFCVLALFLGYYSFRAADRGTVRAIHRRLGRLSIISIIAALLLGLNLIGIF